MVFRGWNRYFIFFSHHVIRIQGSFYLMSGIWPLLSIRTFQAVTGPKTDVWLVQTVGLLLMINGLILILASFRRQIDWLVFTIGVCTPLALIGIELVNVSNGTISVVYLLDATVETLFVIAWAGKKTSTGAYRD